MKGIKKRKSGGEGPPESVVKQLKWVYDFHRKKTTKKRRLQRFREMAKEQGHSSDMIDVC